MKSLYFLFVLALGLGLFSTAVGQVPAPSTPKELGSKAASFIKQYCLKCHTTEKKEGELDLEVLLKAGEASKPGNTKIWRKVREMLDTNEMPPKESKQPTAADKGIFTTWLKTFLEDLARATAGDPGRVVLRRLNNAEYTYTVSDLAGIALNPVKEFPADSAAGEGFTNTGNALVMSPALLSKYLVAAKGIAEHAILLPDGIRFSASTTRRDWTNEILDQIRTIYRRETEILSSARANLQGIIFDTNDGGKLPLERYITATLLHRNDIAAGKISLAQVAETNRLNPLYLTSLWKLFQRKDHLPLLGRIQELWTNAKVGDEKAVHAEIALWQGALTKFQSVGHMKPWMVSVNPFKEREEFRTKLVANTSMGNCQLFLVASEVDDPRNDFVEWENPRILVPGRDDIPLRFAGLYTDLARDKRAKLYAASQGALQAAEEALLSRNGWNITQLADKFQVPKEDLELWFGFLGIRQTQNINLTHFKNKLFKGSGHDFVNGWGSPETPSIMANSSNQLVRIPGDLKGKGVVVHPSPTLAACVGWQSPISGAYTIEAKTTHAHVGCGNGVTWSLEIRRGATRRKIAGGIAHGAQAIKAGPFKNVAIQKGDLVSLIIGPRDGNHSCDLTDVELLLQNQESKELKWNLTSDVSGNIQSANPHEDSLGNAGIWHFYTEPVTPGSESVSAIPAGSFLDAWQGTSDPKERNRLAQSVQQLLTKGPSKDTTPPNVQLYQSLSSLSGPLLGLWKPTFDLKKDKLDLIKDKPVSGPVVGTDPKHFGKHPNGEAVDASNICVQAPNLIEITLPADLWGGATFAASATLHGKTGMEGSVQLQVLAAKPERMGGLRPDLPIIVKGGSETKKRFEEGFEAFRQAFPAAVCYTKIVPVDEVVTLTLYHREDEPFRRLLLTPEQNIQLDRLWKDLHYVSQDAFAEVDAFIQLMEFATQDSNPALFEPYRKPILASAEALKKQLVATEPQHLNGVLGIAAKAFRRPLTKTEDSELRALYSGMRKQDIPHDAAIRLTLAKVFVSPAFLYRLEKAGEGEVATRVSPQELGSRLSYFLWSSTPDQELLEEINSGSLNEAQTLAKQTRRMIKGPLTRRLATEFACQWLHIYEFDKLDEKSERHFPEFTKLRSDMYEESIRFFTDLFQNDRSILSILDADHTFVNESLAKFYGLDSKGQTGWFRVDGMRKKGRGGILGMATTLAKQSGASRTSPILRGNWVAEVLLGERLPRPPKDVPKLPEDETQTQGQTVRQLVEKHSSDPRCAVCHVRIDPFGFSLESFDPIGRLRTKDLGNRIIQTKATLRDGQEIDGIEGLRANLLGPRRDAFVRQFCKKLLGYALGRETQLSDEPLLEKMQLDLAKNGYRFSVALEAIVTSDPFRNIRGRLDDRE